MRELCQLIEKSREKRIKTEIKKPRRCGRRNEGRRIPQGRNEEIRKDGIGIGKTKKKEEKRRKRREQRTTEESCTLIYVVGYRNGENKRGREEKGRVERRNANEENSRGRERKPRNNWRSGGGRISCCLASAPFKESLAFC